MVLPTRATRAAGANALGERGLPTIFEIDGLETLGLNLPADRDGEAIRVWARSLTVMQKEAIVHSTRSARAWRLASDEGPYLNGHDVAPCPLSFLTTGMVSSYMHEIVALARRRGVDLDELVLTQHNYYTMEGSARRGTMTGGALPVELGARARSRASDAVLEQLIADAVDASPVQRLLAESLESAFSLTRNGAELAPGRAKALDHVLAPAGRAVFDGLVPVASGEQLVEKRRAVEATAGVPGGSGTSLKESQSRTLHLKATCRLREDGAKLVEQELMSPLGSTFAFVCDEPETLGGQGRAPGAMSYVSAGIAFCFMTQLGRYAKILGRNLDAYDIVQDTSFSRGGGSGRASEPGAAEAVETHVHLTSAEDDEFARACLDMGEQTCFLHALCRTPLETRIRVERM